MKGNTEKYNWLQHINYVLYTVNALSLHLSVTLSTMDTVKDERCLRDSTRESWLRSCFPTQTQVMKY